MTNSTISSAKYSGKQPNCLEGVIEPSLEYKPTHNYNKSINTVVDRIKS